MIRTSFSRVVLAASLFAGCGDFDGGAINEAEVITTVILNFAPTTGATVTAMFDDPDGDGGAAPTIDPIDLTAGSYSLTVQFQNRLVTPPEESTEEVREEQDFHLVLFTGTAPLAHTYADLDDNGLPVGLTSTIVASTGAGQLTVTLRHMPPEEPPVKSETTVMEAQTDGIDSIGGSTDVQVNFTVTVP